MSENIRVSEVSDILRKQLEGINTNVQLDEIGTVLQVSDGVVRIYGLRNAEANELLEFDNGIKAIVMNLEEDNVGAVLLGPTDRIKEGFIVKRTKRIASIRVGEGMLGRVIDPLGEPLDGKGLIGGELYEMPLERKAPGVIYRQPVNQPLQTGLKAVDAMIPIGRGQRELIIGDRQTGKTSIAVDTILNQKGQDVICIYVAIGQKASTVSQIVTTLSKHGAMDYSIVVSASASDLASLQYIAPYAGTAIAEHFMHQGKDVLIVYDDLSKHAVAYRAISLLLDRPPGREAYPGDVFYLHSRLLERACRLNEENGGGSITALPIIETQAGDISAYIPTNVISITDGQIFLQQELFNSGFRPAVDTGLSVSRVGSTAQIKAMKQVSGSLKLELAQYAEMQAFAQFGSDLDAATKATLDHGAKVREVLKQAQYSPRSVPTQVITLFALKYGYTKQIAVEKVKEFMDGLVENIQMSHPEFITEIETQKVISNELEAKMKEATGAYVDQFLKTQGAN